MGFIISNITYIYCCKLNVDDYGEIIRDVIIQDYRIKFQSIIIYKNIIY